MAQFDKLPSGKHTGFSEERFRKTFVQGKLVDIIKVIASVAHWSDNSLIPISYSRDQQDRLP